MKLITRDKLLQMPVGTIFRRFELCALRGESWMRFEGPCGSDFYESTIGPSCFGTSFYGNDRIPPELKSQMGNRRDCDFLLLSPMSGREGEFEMDARYVVLEATDIQVMIEQMTGGQTSPERFLALPDKL